MAVTEFSPLSPDRRAPRPLIAIGDVHGYPDALARLIDHLGESIARDYGGEPVDLVYLGDYVDRGPDPLGVLALIREGLKMPNVSEHALMGNHDRFLIAAARLRGLTMEMTEWAVWLANGGRETLSGLGDLTYMTARPERIMEALGPENAAFLEGLSLSLRFGDFFCAHAGVDPAKALDDQSEKDLIWIREPFLRPAEQEDGPWPPGVTVVHGHTPGAYGVFPHRIGCDTGGYSTGVFTAVEIRDGRARFHHALRDI